MSPTRTLPRLRRRKGGRRREGGTTAAADAQRQESMTYDRIRDLVAKREPGWETLQNALVSLNPVRAKEDPVIVRNVPYYKAKKAIEAEVMKLDAPPRPNNWGMQELNLPLNETLWSKQDLNDPRILLEMTTLLNAQRDMAEKILNAQWEIKWRQQKLNELLEEKVLPYRQSMDNDVLPEPIFIQSQKKETKKMAKRRWWFF